MQRDQEQIQAYFEVGGSLALFTQEQREEILKLSADMADAYGKICDVVVNEMRGRSEYIHQIARILAPLIQADMAAFLERIQEIQETIDSLRLQETDKTLPGIDGLPTPRNVEGWRDRPQIVKGSQNTRPRREPWTRR